MTNIAIVLIVVSVVGLAGLLIYYSILKKKYSQSSILHAKDTLVVKNKVNFKDTFDKLYQMLYMTYVKMPLLKYYAKKIRLKYEMSNDYTEYELRRNTGRLMTITLVVVFIALAVFVNVVNDLYMTLIVLVGLIIVAEKVIDLTITSVSNKILRQMPEAFTILRHSFHEHGMVDEAIADTIDELSEKEILVAAFTDAFQVGNVELLTAEIDQVLEANEEAVSLSRQKDDADKTKGVAA